MAVPGNEYMDQSLWSDESNILARLQSCAGPPHQKWNDSPGTDWEGVLLGGKLELSPISSSTTLDIFSSAQGEVFLRFLETVEMSMISFPG